MHAEEGAGNWDWGVLIGGQNKKTTVGPYRDQPILIANGGRRGKEKNGESPGTKPQGGRTASRNVLENWGAPACERRTWNFLEKKEGGHNFTNKGKTGRLFKKNAIGVSRQLCLG